jgi:hypothetical protein
VGNGQVDGDGNLLAGGEGLDAGGVVFKGGAAAEIELAWVVSVSGLCWCRGRELTCCRGVLKVLERDAGVGEDSIDICLSAGGDHGRTGLTRFRCDDIAVSRDGGGEECRCEAEGGEHREGLVVRVRCFGVDVEEKVRRDSCQKRITRRVGNEWFVSTRG